MTTVKLTFPLIFTLLFVFTTQKTSAQASLCNADDSYEHVIITSTALKNQTADYTLATLRDHRISKGMSSTIVTTEDIYATYTGRDNAEKVRNFIRDAKAKWETKYVLLGGDINHVPHRMLFARNRYVAADMYFGCLDGDFNANNNDKWGEPGDDLDFTFDVHIGRASAENITEMSNFVYKTITYENSPINASYHTKTMLFNQNASGVGKIDFWAGEIRGLTNQLSVEYYYLTNQQATPITNNRMNSKNLGYFLGASHGFVDGHGNINHNQARSYSNANQFYFFMSIACLVGRFEQDCVIETLCTSTRTGGAFAAFANSHESYAPFVTQFIRVKMRDLVFKDNVYELGRLRSLVQTRYSESEYNSKEGERYQAYIFNLFGDPATPWRINQSEPVDVIYHFDEVRNDSCFDHSGNHHAAIISGGVSSVTGMEGNGLLFNGIDGKVTVQHSDWNPMGDQMELTLATWIKPKKFANGSGIMVKGDTKNPFALTLNAEGKMVFEMNINTPLRGLKSAIFTSTTACKLDKWQHIAVTIDYTSAKLNFYINGIQSGSFAMPADWLIGYTDQPFYIGYDSRLASGYFNGAIDETYVYSRSLNPTEIVALMNKASAINTNRGIPNTNQLMIYPNPAAMGTHVSVRYSGTPTTNNSYLKIFDFRGQKVSNIPLRLNENSSDIQTIQLPLLPSGLYLVALTHNNILTSSTRLNILN
jgi:hypothetical protein